MLQQRVITALVLLGILLPALFSASPLPFTLVVLVLMAAGAWEWGRLNGLGHRGSLVMGAACVALCALSWQQGWLDAPLPWLWRVGGCSWVVASAWLLYAGVPAWSRIPTGVRWIAGVLALWLAWLAVVQARMVGINFLLSVLLLVWVADIFAYFAGRAWGLRFTRRKLAPSISPGKSWEGAGGGAAGVAVLATAWVLADAYFQSPVLSFYSQLASRGLGSLAAAVLFMVAMSVAGDLVESLIKRSAGVKDSSGLLPGHGGVLDRVDALLPTLPLAMMLISGAQA
ncbi:MAG: phosphatidate cytidylyltransferase [Burkholderiaceae bacterium]|nr:phosphatidate cytidylyltransferase [Burkholderiaceae bacterium]